MSNSREEAFPKTRLGIILSNRRGPKTLKPKEYLLKFSGVETANEASRLIGRKVAWPLGNRKFRGKIMAVHGKNGIVRARFSKGVPALGSHMEIIG